MTSFAPSRRLALLALEDTLRITRRIAALAESLSQTAQKDGVELTCMIGLSDAQTNVPWPTQPTTVFVRPMTWGLLPRQQVRIAGDLLQQKQPPLQDSHYAYPEDELSQFIDCDGWILVGNSTQAPVAPLKPHWVVTTDVTAYDAPVPPEGFAAYQTLLSQAEAVFAIDHASCALLHRRLGLPSVFNLSDAPDALWARLRGQP